MKKHIIYITIAACILLSSCNSSRKMARQERREARKEQVATNPSNPTPSTTNPTNQPAINTGNNNEANRHSNQTNTNPQSTKPTPKKPKYNFKTLSTNVTCTVGNYSANAQLRMLNDSIIWLTVSKFIELGRAYITPDSVKAYIKVTNEYIAGSWTDIQLKYNVDINFETVQDMLLGETVKTKVVSSTASDYQTFGKLKLAKLINVVVKHPRINQTARLKYTTPEVDKALAFPFSIPRSASKMK